MDEKRKKQLQEEYRMMPTYYGIIQIKNEANGKIFIEAVPNIKNRWNYYKLNLNNNFYKNTPLQADWIIYNEEDFSFEVLWKKKTDDVVNMKEELKKIKKEWLEKLQPYDDKGYNKPMRED
ncbi:MAG: GIY-YIG nuclease family protein [Enterococcus sp.]